MCFKMASGCKYDSNPTMRLVGKQTLEWFNQALFTALDEILEGNGIMFLKELVNDTLYDVYLYGCMTGVRGERQRKKAKTQADNLK